MLEEGKSNSYYDFQSWYEELKSMGKEHCGEEGQECGIEEVWAYQGGNTSHRIWSFPSPQMLSPLQEELRLAFPCH